MEEKDKLFVRRYLTTSRVLKNAQRPGAVTNLTLEEWAWAVSIESLVPYVVVSMADHKTAASHRSARLVISEDLAQLITTYIVSYKVQLMCILLLAF